MSEVEGKEDQRTNWISGTTQDQKKKQRVARTHSRDTICKRGHVLATLFMSVDAFLRHRLYTWAHFCYV